MIVPETRQAILVLGMHRSGTSALAGILSLCGASLPATLMPPADYNPKGFFESGAIFQAHQQLLAELGSSWDDQAPLPDGWVELPLGRRHIAEMATLMEAEFGSSTLLVLKDPRICRLVPFWTEVLRALSIDFSFALPVRNPLEVAQSLEEAQGVPLKKGLLLWLSHFLQAERDTRPYRRSFLSYEQLLTDWKRRPNSWKKIWEYSYRARPREAPPKSMHSSKTDSDTRSSPRKSLMLDPTFPIGLKTPTNGRYKRPETSQSRKQKSTMSLYLSRRREPPSCRPPRKRHGKVTTLRRKILNQRNHTKLLRWNQTPIPRLPFTMRPKTSKQKT